MKLESITGPELKAIRRKAGINQTEMGKLIGASRSGVSYWETKQHPLTSKQYRFGVPAMMFKVLGIEILPIYLRSTRARGYGVLPLYDAAQAMLDREMERRRAKLQAQMDRRRQPCGAKTRKGHPCRMKSEPGKRRCKYHGGKSTGPKTAEGKARIAEAQRKRWEAYRRKKYLT
ncbi:HGGxSTG domain-containing protein [Roseovarius aestuarii]|uniref:HTH cro/C1-type domain-containing protein n=1 Tax=Roseovarius aestuarii TaxID=475083 RepID=A0A1X7BVW2_9RHOB|nr:HGGxSTG domain-containing protein [Roseovarius aestuarii]SMC13734.1 hypothetical protein ROA7745_03593 [Roseovarius aestuarii]